MHTVPAHTDRRPLAGVSKKVAAVLAVLGSAVSTLATIGAITVEQDTAVQGSLAALVGLVTAVTAVLTAFGIVKRAEPLVTPMSDPRNDEGVPLTPVD